MAEFEARTEFPAPTGWDEAGPWHDDAAVRWAGLLVASYRRWLGRPLIEPTGDDRSNARRLFEAPFVVVSHGTQADPILNYANAAALRLWEMDWPTLTATPSRCTAEPVHRDERAQMLARLAHRGCIADYSGVRISRSGRRFRIDDAIVWNVVDAHGTRLGQAACFSHWHFLDADTPTEGNADAIIAALGLAPHPEGGVYRETWRDAPPGGGRGSGTAIYFLLRAGERSHWHRVDATEIWHFYDGAPLELSLTNAAGVVERHVLGRDVARGESPQLIVPAGAWQSARSLGAYTLVGCTVSPAFDFAGFTLAEPGWEPPSR